MNLLPAAKEELALALLLWKDFKSDGKFDLDVSLFALKFAEELGVAKEFEKLLTDLPPLKITLRHS